MTDPESTHDMSKNSVLNRHYSTIGIDAFLDPPPASLLPRSYLAPSSALQGDDACFLTWEIVGDIKTCPEDFVVREIASRKRTPKLPEDFDMIANLSPSSSSLSSIEKSKEDQGSLSCEVNKRVSNDDETRKADETNETDVKRENLPTKNSLEPVVASSSPSETVKAVLEDAFGNEKMTSILNQLERLQERAVVLIKEHPPSVPSDDYSNTDIVWIPPLSSSSAQDIGSTPNRGGTRGLLHRNLRLVFPLLKSETIMHTEDMQPPHANVSVADDNARAASAKEENAVVNIRHPWIQVSIDDTFFGLAPFLFQPDDDIMQLCSFRNRGCVLSPSAKQQHGRGRKRKRERNVVPVNDESVVFLRLRPDLSRENRRTVHHLISNVFRDSETSTIPNYCSATTEEGGPPQDIAAIVVKWSKRAQQRAKKKSNGSNNSSTGSVATNTLCVLKKTKREHLSVIKRLTYAIRCRQSDIGLAGIKDMHAVTYQFCTIANVSPQRVERAKAALRSQGIELGRIQRVDWTLNQGDLHGNRFEVVIRNVKRIRVEIKQGVPSEVRAPCEKGHVLARLECVRKSGFLNFYGEQRLGIPGRASEVGVRSFDIGRALLQQDFSNAIDLLMTGRLVCRGEDDLESPEVRQARQVWKETNGDVDKTLKAIPKGDAMGREKVVLQGLKRYGDDVAAFKCLHFGVRTFFINAYQSYVWNAMASERLKRFGTSVVEGDLYRLPDDERRNSVRVVTANSSSVDISNVVLPLPGYAVQYPENEMGALYREFLRKENVCFDRNAPAESTAKGSYRPLIVFAQNLEVSFDSKAASAPTTETQQDEVSEFKLKFDLPSGSYATMLMRELMVTTVTR